MTTKNPVHRSSVSALALAASFSALAVLTGCSGMQTTASPSPLQTHLTLKGSAHGGQQPLTGSHIYLFAVGTTGYGSASTSYLTGLPPAVLRDLQGGYVLTDSAGNFDITGDYSCAHANDQTYLLSSGGNPGLAPVINNTAITILAALGSCGNLSASTYITMNEVSTAAAVTALQQFMVDGTHIGASAGNAAGIANAFNSIANLADLATGTARTATVLGNGTVPQTKLNTLGNILAPCINSAGPTSPSCVSLFNAATPAGGTAPVDTAAAMLSIAKFPGSHTAALFAQITPAAPFQPTLAAAPNDYTLGITYTGGGLVSPGAVVIDANGSAWVANCPNCPGGPTGIDSIIGLGPQGAVLSGARGFTAGIHSPQGIAFDLQGSLWSTNTNVGTQDEVVKQTSSGTIAPGFPFSNSNLGNPLGIALDSAGAAWVASNTPGTMLKISATGTQVGIPVTTPAFGSPTGVGIDGSGIIFATGTVSNSILKFNSAGAILSGVNGPGYTGAGINQPLGIAIDNADHVWTLDNGTNAVSVILGTDGSAISGPSGYTGGIYQAAVVAIDGAGTAWLANCRIHCPGNLSAPDNVLHLAANGAKLNLSDGFQNPGFNTVGTAAIDGSGNVWVSNFTGASLTELLGVAAPVVTPLARAASTNTLGTRP